MVLAKDSCNRPIRRAGQAERCNRVCNLVAGLALLIASPVVVAQEQLHDIDIPSLNAAQALNDNRTGFWKRLTASLKSLSLRAAVSRIFKTERQGIDNGY